MDIGVSKTMIEMILSTISSWITEFIASAGYTGIIFLMAIESAGIPAPSEIIMPFAGFLVQKSILNFWSVVLFGTLGNLLGSIVAYWVGYWGGRPLVDKYGKYIFLSHRDLNLADRFFDQRGNLTVFIGRLLPVVRTYISFPAGLTKMNFGKFCIYTTLGSLPWCIALTYIGVRLGEHWNQIKEYTRGFDLVILVIFVIGIYWWIRRHALDKSEARNSKSEINPKSQ